MSVAPIAAWSLNDFLLERRSRQRFPLALAVEYRLLGKSRRRGSGKTRNISSSGVLLEVTDRESLSGSIELTMRWPCLLDDECALKLVVKGRVVRSAGSDIAVESLQHEFRTAGPAKTAKRANLKLKSSHP